MKTLFSLLALSVSSLAAAADPATASLRRHGDHRLSPKLADGLPTY